MEDKAIEGIYQAIQALEKEIHEIKQAIVPEIRVAQTKGFDELGFRRELKNKNLSKNTIESYIDRVNKFFKAYDEINEDNLKEFENNLKELSPKTFNLSAVAMQKYFDYIGYSGYSLARIKEQKKSLNKK